MGDPLIVPTVVPGGSLHFATITAEGTVQDVLDALISNEEVTAEVLGDLEPYGWAVQRIRREHNGRQWEEDELEALGNGAHPHQTFAYPLDGSWTDYPRIAYVVLPAQGSSRHLRPSHRC